MLIKVGIPNAPNWTHAFMKGGKDTNGTPKPTWNVQLARNAG
jgi:hypothetical protein